MISQMSSHFSAPSTIAGLETLCIAIERLGDDIWKTWLGMKTLKKIPG